MPLVEINFDGIVGPSHNFAGLSLGNVAATANAGRIAYPRAAALQGLAKMRANMERGLVQGFLPPLPRPNIAWLQDLGSPPDRALIAGAWSASSMWTANAATVSPAPDTADGRCHLTVANLVTMPHRSHEWPDTLKALQLAFADPAFVVHRPVPPPFGDEGAANHMRMTPRHDAPGVEIFVYGTPGGPFPARQHEQASRAVARLHGLDPDRVLLVEQSADAIAAGAFHNDVVAVANELVLLCHEQAFAWPEAVFAAIRKRLPEAEIVVVPASEVPLADAISSYLFNAQLVTESDGAMTLLVPSEAMATASVAAWVERTLAGNGPIRRIEAVDLTQSMANGGGPACLRLRVVCDPATVDSRFLLDEAKLARIETVVSEWWPETIAPDEVGDEGLAERIKAARAELLRAVGLIELA